MKKTSQEKFIAAAEQAEFVVELAETTYKRSVATYSRYASGTLLTEELRAKGWERGKQGCTSSSSNFKGTTYWIESPCVLVVVRKNTGDKYRDGGEVRLHAKFDDGRYVGGYDTKWRHNNVPMSDLVHTMTLNTEEHVSEQRAKQAAQAEGHRKNERSSQAAEFRRRRAHNRAVLASARALVADHGVDGLKAAWIVDAMYKEGMLHTNPRGGLVALASLWSRTNLHREPVTA